MATKLEKMLQQRKQLNADIRKRKRAEAASARKDLLNATHALGVALARRHGARTPAEVTLLVDRLVLAPKPAAIGTEAATLVAYGDDAEASEPANHDEHRSEWFA